jgi:hypothetical protein
MTATRGRTTRLAGLLAGIPAMLAGLFALEVHPIAGTLIILAAMALLLSSAAEFCQEHGIYQTYLQEKR